MLPADLERLTITPVASIQDAMRAIDTGGVYIALVKDDAGRLLGTITDGDVRRAILRGEPLTFPAGQVMNHNPTVAAPQQSRAEVLELMLAREVKHVPVVDAAGRLVGLHVIDDLLRPPTRENIAVVMAGGLGERLRPFTATVPKPLLLVGNQPILERVLRQLQTHGFRHVFLSVNFMADKIQGYFQSGSAFGLKLSYLKETQPLGTAGALALLPQRPQQPFVVMNADLLTELSYSSLLDFHAAEKAALTVCVCSHETQIPYGVLELDGARVVSIVEKPKQTVFINAGIYAVEPRCLDLIPQDTPFDMPSLIQSLLARGEKVASFPITESWLDIGQLHDYQRAIMQAFQKPPGA
jgi:dTDP-glucose pyrophosphorylase